MKQFFDRIKNGVVSENPIFVQVLAMCPTLAVTTSAENAIGMGIASTIVLIFSNMIISSIRKLIPDKIRIPSYIVIIASFVTMVDMFMNAYFQNLYKSLGIFIPLIVVNCIILGRAEAYASKNRVLPSIYDGLGMGIGFTVALLTIGAFRELIGAGSIFGIQILPSKFQPVGIMVLAPGAFITVGGLMVLIKYFNIRTEEKYGHKVKKLEHNCGNCSGCGVGLFGTKSEELVKDINRKKGR